MPTLTIPLTTIAQTDPDLLDLPSAHPDDAAFRLRMEFAFLSEDLTVTIQDGVATFTWPGPTPAALARARQAAAEATRLARRGQYTSAEERYYDALRGDPLNLDTRLGFAMTQLEIGRVDAAKFQLTRILLLDPANANALLTLGNLYFQRDRNLAAAERCYAAALAVRPDDALILNAVAALHAARGDLAEAVCGFQRVIELAPALPAPRHGLALAYAKQGDFDAALSALPPVFKVPAPTDPRTAVALWEARKTAYELHARRAELHAGEPLAQVTAQFAAWEQATGVPIRVEVNPKIQTDAKLEPAWRYQRPYHIIVIADDNPGRPYTLAHEFEHLRMLSEARAAGRNRLFASSEAQREQMLKRMDKDIERAARRTDFTPAQFSAFLQRSSAALVTELFNAPLDMLIDWRLRTTSPWLWDVQFIWLAQARQRDLRVLSDAAVAATTPAPFYHAAMAMDAALAVFTDDLTDGATDFAVEYEHTGQLPAARKLFGLYAQTRDHFQPGAEYDLVDAWAKALRLEGWYGWRVDTEELG